MLAVASAAIVVALVACGGGDSSAGPATNIDGGSTGPDTSTPLPDGDTRLPDGAVVGPDGAIVTFDGSHPSDGGTGSCLGSSLLGGIGKNHLLVGGTMADATASSAPIDIRYVYLSGGLFDGTSPCASCATGCTAAGKSCANSVGCAWWGCWQYDQVPPGQYAKDLVTKASGATPVQVPMFTYYEILQTSGAAEGAAEVQATNDAALMTRYYADWRFLLQSIGQNVAFVHIEPDFWGYAEQIAVTSGSDAHAIASAVATANATDCGGIENSIAGMGQCMIAMVRKYAPNTQVGLQASAWATNYDVAMNNNASFDVAGEARKVATFLSACGAGSSDFVVVEASDRDAGYYQSIGRNAWWDATNATLPDFHQDLAWVKALTEAMNVPALYWQIPLGNMSLPNVTNQWQDNRVDYFFGHMDEVAGAHAVGIAYGAGAGGQTTPESDNGNFVAKVKAYAQAGGQALCP
jgi:hypothetical protein